MADYPGLQRLTDPAVKSVCKQLFDQIQSLQARVGALEEAALQKAGETIDADGGRLINVAAGVAGSDAVNLTQLRAYTDAVKKATY